MFKISIFNHQSSIIFDDALPTIGPGTAVIVDAIPANSKDIKTTQQIGWIESIGLSPYYPECEQGVQRAYVTGNGWSDYLLIDDLLLATDTCDCPDCGKLTKPSMQCPECGNCLACCDCMTENADDFDEDTDYQAPRFLWMGRWFPG